MLRYLEWLVIFALVARTEVAGQEALAPGDNIQYFELLCRLYNTAVDPPLPQVFPQEPFLDMGTLTLINASLAQDDWFKTIQETPATGEPPEAFKQKYPGYAKHWSEWRHAVEKVSASEKFKRLNPEKSSTKEAQVRIERILHKAKALNENFGKLDAARKLEEIRTKFDEAAFGVGGKQTAAWKNPTGATRADACGRTGLSTAGEAAGKSLVGDILCLCAPHTNGGGQKDACGTNVGNPSSYTWKNSDKNHLQNIWEATVKNCAAERLPGAMTVPQTRELLADFLRAVDKGGVCKGSAPTNKPGMVGTFAESGSCSSYSGGCSGDGSSTGGACVVYGVLTGIPSSVAWYTKINEALKAIEQVQGDLADIHHDAIRFKMLEANAEEIYEEAKMAGESGRPILESPTKNPGQQQNPGTPTDKTTFKEPNALNGATVSRFILPWTLLV